MGIVEPILPRADPRVGDRSSSLIRNSFKLTAYATLLAGDCLAIAVATFGADLVRNGASHVEVAALLWLIVSLFHAFFAVRRWACSEAVLKSLRSSVTRSAAAGFSAVVALICLTFFWKQSEVLSRTVIGMMLVLIPTFIAVGRLITTPLVAKALTRGTSLVVILNDMASADDHKFQPAKLEAHRTIDTWRLGLQPDAYDPVMLDRLGALLRDADRIVLFSPPERRSAWASTLQSLGTRVEIVLPELGTASWLGFGNFQDQITAVTMKPVLSFRDRVTKRAFDLALSTLLLAALSPLFAIIALAIKLDSRGPVFFRQKRVGQGNRLFEIFKFRTMRMETSDANGVRSATRDDDRITRLGALLRRTSIDELPQLINILKGDMSIVGPRPHALGSTADDYLFWEIDQRYWHRHAVKPGLTGLAQVRGFRGATHCRDDLVRRLQADLEYLDGWSVLRDLRILLQTFGVVVHRNAF